MTRFVLSLKTVGSATYEVGLMLDNSTVIISLGGHSTDLLVFKSYGQGIYALHLMGFSHFMRTIVVYVPMMSNLTLQSIVLYVVDTVSVDAHWFLSS